MSLFRLGWDGIFELVRSDLPWLLWITSIVTWACWGSFLQAVSYRIPNGVSIVVPESHCPNCKKKLLFQDNLPIFGWINLRGKCRFCRTVIPFQYLWMEILMGLLGGLFCWLTLFEMNSPVSWLWALMVTSWLLVLGVIDWHHRYIPDGVCLPPLVIGSLWFMPWMIDWMNQSFYIWGSAYWLVFPILVYGAVRGGFGVFCGEETELFIEKVYRQKTLWRVLAYLAGVVIFALCLLSARHSLSDVSHHFKGLVLAMGLLWGTRFIASAIAKQEAMGLGDVKMAMVLGWWFGPYMLLMILGSACVLGTIFALYSKFRKKDMAQPFGTMMALSAFVVGVFYPLSETTLVKLGFPSLLS